MVRLESKHQNKVLTYIKSLLKENALADDEAILNARAEASERDIDAGRYKKLSLFKAEVAQWQKKKRSALK